MASPLSSPQGNPVNLLDIPINELDTTLEYLSVPSTNPFGPNFDPNAGQPPCTITPTPSIYKKIQYPAVPYLSISMPLRTNLYPSIEGLTNNLLPIGKVTQMYIDHGAADFEKHGAYTPETRAELIQEAKDEANHYLELLHVPTLSERTVNIVKAVGKTVAKANNAMLTAMDKAFTKGLHGIRDAIARNGEAAVLSASDDESITSETSSNEDKPGMGQRIANSFATQTRILRNTINPQKKPTIDDKIEEIANQKVANKAARKADLARLRAFARQSIATDRKIYSSALKEDLF